MITGENKAAKKSDAPAYGLSRSIMLQWKGKKS
jgi:hypothetical protein